MDATGQGNALNVRPRKSDLTDVNFFLKSLDTKLFPGVKSNVKAHNGFLDEHAKTASQILAEVKNQISKTGAEQVITVSTPQSSVLVPELFASTTKSAYL